jgi:hypothetical protein
MLSAEPIAPGQGFRPALNLPRGWGLRAMILHAFRPMVKNTLRGFATVELSNGLIIEDLTIHTKGDRSWVGMPGKPQMQDGRIKEVNGKPQYVNILKWSSRERGDKFSDEVVKLIKSEHAHALD